MRDACRWCGSIDLVETIMDHGPHYSRIDCKDCGKFVKWGKKPDDREPAEPGNTKENRRMGGIAMNKVMLVGRLTKDPELRYTTANNVPVCTFTLAVDRRYKSENGPQADFLPIVTWRSAAEFCSKYFRKGRKVIVFGRVETRSWEDQDGQKHYITEIVADEVDFADSKKDDTTAPPPPPEVPPEPPKTQGQPGNGYPIQDLKQQAAATAATRPASPPPQAYEKMPWEE